MPELPEVETVRQDLERLVCGRSIATVTLGRLRSVRRYEHPELFVRQLEGTQITAIRRLGKYLLVDVFDDAKQQQVLVIHLRMSGQLLFVEDQAMDLRAHTHVRLTFRDGSELRFVDPRTFGELFVTAPALTELEHVGPDAWTDLDSVAEFRARFAGRKASLKGSLLDQSVLAGVGSIYADELCFRAKVRPARSTSTLRPIDYSRLFQAMKDVLGEAIAHRGSTLGDGQYVGLDGVAGTFAQQHRVHARAGSACGQCGAIIRRAVVAQRSAYWCPTCQK